MDDGRRNLEEEDVMGEIIRDGAEVPAPSTGDDIDVTLSFPNDTDIDGEEEGEEAGSEDEEVDHDEDYDERTEEGAVAKSGEVYIY